MSPRLFQIGNVGPGSAPNSTENDVRKAFEHLGWDVDPMAETEFTRVMAGDAWGPVYDRALAADLVVHTLTQGSYPNPERVLDLWRACERAGVPTASIHLDLFYGLSSQKDRGPQRHELPRLHPQFRTAWVFTADGGHDAEFTRDGVNHHWLPPGVNHEEAVDVATDDNSVLANISDARMLDIFGAAMEGDFLVGFAGSDGYHMEWPHRPQLVQWLRDTYRDRFLHIGGSSTPRVTGLALNRIFASVPVWVGDSCMTAPAFRYHSDRIPETWGRGGFLVHPRADHLNEMYAATGRCHPGSSWVTGDWRRLHVEVEYWLGADVEREATRRAFVDHTRAHDTYVNRVQTMLDTIGLTVLV